MKIIDLTGKRFGRLTMLGQAAGRITLGGQLKTRWNARCDCGIIKIVDAEAVRTGRSTSCGCYRTELSKKRFRTHGLTGTSRDLMLRTARQKAKKNKLPFNLTLADIVIPKICPLLGIPIIPIDGQRGKRTSRGPTLNSPSLDRKRPELGYVRDNVWVISYRANSIKNDASVAELRQIADNLEKVL